MSQRNQKKPSLILMLAPIPAVIFGYHFLFHSQLNSDLAKREKQEAALQQQIPQVQREIVSLHGQLKAAGKSLAEAEKQTAIAREQLAATEADKAALRSSFRQGAVEVSVVTEGVYKPGACRRMDSLCSILDKHDLLRLETTGSGTRGRGSSGLVESERARLEKLLDTQLPPVSRYNIQFVGSFPNLILSLHDLSRRLPEVRILSVSLDPVDAQTQRHVWKLEVGIRG